MAEPDWDAHLRHYPSATIFHTAAWARVLHDTYGFTPIYFATGDNRNPGALLPVMEVDSWLTGRRGVSLPFTDECEPLCADADSFRELFQTALDHGASRHWRYFECRGGRPWLGDVPPSTTFWGHRLELDGGEAALLARTAASVRRAIRKAEHNGLVIEFSQGLEAMQDFHRLLDLTRLRLGAPLQPWDLFRNIQRHVIAPGHGWVVLARHRAQAVAGAVFFHFNRTALFKFGASDENFLLMRGNNLVMWEAIKRYAGDGFSALDFGRTSLGNQGLRRFKLGWGAVERRIDYFRYNLAAGRFVTYPDRSIGWHNRLFRALPPFLSRLIGAIVYKHIA